MDDLAMRVRAARAYAGLNQPELAERVGTSPATLKRFESGHRSLGDLERATFIERVAAATGLPAEFFTVKDLGAAVKFTAGMDELDAEIRAGGNDPPPDPVLERLERVEAMLSRVTEAMGLADKRRDPTIAFAEALEAAVRDPREPQQEPGATADANG